MANPLFQTIPIKAPGKSTFDLSHEIKLSCQMGALIPFFCQDSLPGDTWRSSFEVFVRFAPMLAPVMHRIDVYTWFFKVPMRLVFDDWEDFITGGRDGTAAPIFPRLTNYKIQKAGSLCDYLGYPTAQYTQSGGPADMEDNYTLPLEGETLTTIDLSLIPLRVYHLIWSEYFRDQNLSVDISDMPILHDGGIFDYESIMSNNEWKNWFFNIRYKAWEKDYFTSALPWAQRGPSVTVPIGSTAPVTYKMPASGTSSRDILRNPNGSPLNLGDATSYNVTMGSLTSNGTQLSLLNGQEVPAGVNVVDELMTSDRILLDNSANLQVDLSDATAVTINELRRLFAMQRFFEKNAIGGSRYVEQILAHFGVVSSDARLQRPEFLTGSKSPVQISEVLQQSQSTDSDYSGGPSVLGDMAGRAIAVSNQPGFSTFCEEHCVIMGIMCIMPRSSYQQGVSRFLTKFDKFDFAWPDFANLGEQEVYNYELCLNNASRDTETFGYQSRYAEYKFITSHIHGKFKTDLSFWHLGRVFDSAPDLNSSFITFAPPEVERIFPVQGQDVTDEHCYVQIMANIECSRPLPFYATPSNL